MGGSVWRMYLVHVAVLSLLASAASLPPPPGWVPRIASSLRPESKLQRARSVHFILTEKPAPACVAANASNATAVFAGPQLGAGMHEGGAVGSEEPTIPSRELIRLALQHLWPEGLALQCRLVLCVVVLVLSRVCNMLIPLCYKGAIDVLSETKQHAEAPRPGPAPTSQVLSDSGAAWLLQSGWASALSLVSRAAGFFSSDATASGGLWSGAGGGEASLDRGKGSPVPGPEGEAMTDKGRRVLGYVAAYVCLKSYVGVQADVRNLIFTPVSQSTRQRLQLTVLAHLHALSHSYHLTRKTGAVLQVVDRGSTSLQTLLSLCLFHVAPTLLDIVLCASVFVYSGHGALAVVMACTMAVYLSVTAVVTDWRTKFRREMLALEGKSKQRIVESISHYDTVKLFNGAALEQRIYGDALRASHAAEVKAERSLLALNLLQQVVMGTGLLVCMVRAARAVLTARMSVGDLVLVNTYLLQLYQPLNWIGSIYRMIQQNLVELEQLFQLLARPVDVCDAPHAADLHVTEVGASVGHGSANETWRHTSGWSVEFENVSFGYDTRRPVLRNVSFRVHQGETVALVGPSGSGKSTIGRLLCRLYDPSAGAIKIAGQDLRNVTLASVRRSVGVVPQDTALFQNTLRFNIAYGQPDVQPPPSVAAVEQAASGAQMHERILSFPDSYDTQVGERGLRLSGGERQRISLARVLLKQAPIVLLDEATSALDSATEAHVQAALREACRGRTSVVIAHRLSTVLHADRILVLVNGSIVEQGSHRELLVRGGRYADMWREGGGRDGRDDEPAGGVLRVRGGGADVAEGFGEVEEAELAGAWWRGLEECLAVSSALSFCLEQMAAMSRSLPPAPSGAVPGQEKDVAGGYRGNVGRKLRLCEARFLQPSELDFALELYGVEGRGEKEDGNAWPVMASATSVQEPVFPLPLTRAHLTGRMQLPDAAFLFLNFSAPLATVRGGGEAQAGHACVYVRVPEVLVEGQRVALLELLRVHPPALAQKKEEATLALVQATIEEVETLVRHPLGCTRGRIFSPCAAEGVITTLVAAGFVPIRRVPQPLRSPVSLRAEVGTGHPGPAARGSLQCGCCDSLPLPTPSMTAAVAAARMDGAVGARGGVARSKAGRGSGGKGSRRGIGFGSGAVMAHEWTLGHMREIVARMGGGMKANGIGAWVPQPFVPVSAFQALQPLSRRARSPRYEKLSDLLDKSRERQCLIEFERPFDSIPPTAFSSQKTPAGTHTGSLASAALPSILAGHMRVNVHASGQKQPVVADAPLTENERARKVQRWTQRIHEWAQRALAVSQRFAYATEELRAPQRGLLQDVVAVAGGLVGGDTGSRSIDKEKNAAAAEAKGHGKNAWCTPPPPWPWEDGDNVVAGPSGWLGGKEGGLLSQIQDGKQGPRAPEQGSLSRWLLAPRVTSHNVSLQSPRLNATQEQETLGEYPSAETNTNRSGEARGADLVAAGALAGADIVMEEAPASTGSELDGVRAPRSRALDAGVCIEAETGGRVEDEANLARAFAVAEMVGSKGWGSREDEIGASKRWAALMQAFGLRHTRKAKHDAPSKLRAKGETQSGNHSVVSVNASGIASFGARSANAVEVVEDGDGEQDAAAILGHGDSELQLQIAQGKQKTMEVFCLRAAGEHAQKIHSSVSTIAS